jgi:acetyl-CoA C-acetyltransferase
MTGAAPLAHIIAARRTAVMPHGGALSGLAVHDLAAPVIRALLADADLPPEAVDEVILSNALGAGGNPARLAALAAGLPERVAGLSLDRQCAGGLDAIGIAAALVAAGQARVVVAGGAESWSRRPIRLATAPGQAPRAYDRPPFTPWPERDPDMDIAADRLARRLGISRAEQDAFAVASHARALAARSRIATELVALPGASQDGFTRHLSPTTAVRAPVLTGSITSANSAVAADAAALVLVVAGDLARRAPRSLAIAAVRTLGAEPEEPGLAPVPAIAAVLDSAGLPPAGLDCAEVMEAYAAQAIACIRGAGLDPARVNRGGGALARGHPIGASGAILAVRLFQDLRAGPGLAAIAAAGGLGTAMVLRP